MSQISRSLISGPVPPSVATSYLLDDGNSAVPAANVLQVSGGIGAETSLGAPNQVVITVKNEGFTWSEQNSNFNASVQNGYFCNAGLTVSLPATAGLTIGNTIIIYVDTTDPVVIQANAGQSIQVGSTISAAAGTSTSSTRGAILELIFKPSDLTWHTQSSLGVWNTV